MNRRDVISTLAAAGATGVFATQAFADGHKHKGHKGHKSHKKNKKLSRVIDDTAECIETGEVCIAHCIELIGNGDTEMADCLKSATAMVATCKTMLTLASADSRLVKDMAKVCAEACADCAKACKKHAKHHDVCEECMEACLECEKSCRALI